LRLVISGRTTNAVTLDFLSLNFNSDYGSNYSETTLIGNGASASSGRQTSQTRINQSLLPASYSGPYIFGSITIDILNYANTSTYKTILLRSATDTNGAGQTELEVGLWRSTAAITEIDNNLGNGNGNWAAGSTITLYGVRTVGQ